MSKTFEVQGPWNQSRAKNVELEGLSVTIRGLGRRGEKRGGSRTHVFMVVAMQNGDDVVDRRGWGSGALALPGQMRKERYGAEDGK